MPHLLPPLPAPATGGEHDAYQEDGKVRRQEPAPGDTLLLLAPLLDLLMAPLVPPLVALIVAPKMAPYGLLNWLR